MFEVLPRSVRSCIRSAGDLEVRLAQRAYPVWYYDAGLSSDGIVEDGFAQRELTDRRHPANQHNAAAAIAMV